MRIWGKVLGCGALFSAVALAAGQAQADDATTATANLNIELTIAQGCSIGFDSTGQGSAGTIKFDSVINLEQPQNKQADLHVRCSKGSKFNYTVKMDKGLHSDGTYSTRNLETSDSEGSHRIAYKVCKDSSCNDIWGDEGDSVLKKVWDGTKDTETIPVYVSVPAQPGTALYKGKYTDTVQATFVMGAPSV